MESLLLFTIIVGIILGFYYTMMAIGLNLVFGVIKIANLAHGDFLILGGYLAFWLYFLFHISPIISLLVVIPVFFLVGMLLYYALVKQIVSKKDSEMISIVAFFGLSIVIEASSFIAFGNSYRTLPLNFLPLSNIQLLGYSLSFILVFIAVISIVVVLLLFYYLNRTKQGLSVRAMMSDPETARAYGLNIQMIYAITIGLGIAITAIAGVFSPYIFGSIYPSEGVLITIIAFSIIIIGALGNPAATIIGGLVYGIVINVTEIYSPSWSFVVVFILLVLIILVRPNGLVGVRIREI